MKIARRHKGKEVEVLTRHNASTGSSGVKKINKITCRPHQKVTGKNKQLLAEKNVHSSPSSMALDSIQQLPEKNTFLPETSKHLTALKFVPGNTLNPSEKIQLQLFPMDDGARVGLEKDGHNPYLELTLRARKKISSVLKHLHCKWGSSSVAVGELMLFPCSILPRNPCCHQRWTSNDSNISAGDVYAAIGCPVVFRLWYGWFSEFEPGASGIPCSFASTEACSQHEGIQRDSGIDIETKNIKQKQTEDDEVTMATSLSLASALGTDSLTNISIGGLFSEASLQGKFNHCDPRFNQSNSGFQSGQLITDSLDAFVAAQTNLFPQGPRLSSHASNLSILDAEETCHAFSFKKCSSSNRDLLASCANADSGSCNQDGTAKSLKFPTLPEVNSLPALAQVIAGQESKPDKLSCSRVCSDESSLGLTGIKWSDSLGPFDLGLPSLQRIINGDSFSFNKFVR